MPAVTFQIKFSTAEESCRHGVKLAGRAAKIILVEDDSDLIETIQLGWPDRSDRIDPNTSYAAFKPVLFSGGLAAAGCVILDIKLSGVSGSQVITEVQRVNDVAIIILSGSGETGFRADIINRGIDDYVLKRLSVKELHACVARLVRRRNVPVHAPGAPAQVNGVTFDRARRVLRRSRDQSELTHAESQLLAALVDAGGRVVARDQLCL